jgi:xylulokinase
MSGELLVGIDVGTTSVKAGLFTLRGERLDAATAAVPTHRPAPLHAEQDPTDWWRPILAALGRFADRPESPRIAAVGLTSQVGTHVFADAAGTPLMPAILWQDGRAAAAAAALDATVSAAEKERWFGGPMPIDASHALARIAHVAATAPDLWNRTVHVLLPRDWCLLHLTGAAVCDPISAIGLTGPDLAYIAPLIARVPGAAARLPPIWPATALAGRIRPGLPLAGRPVAVGTMDAWAGLHGTDAAGEGRAMYLGGTSEILAIAAAARHPAQGVIVFPPHQGIRLHAAPTQAGGAALAWAAALLGQTPAALAEHAARLPAGTPLPLFLPHLAGERAPLWDIASRGAFAGLEAGMGAAELACSVMEGVAFSARLAFEALEASAGLRPETIRCAGGGFAAPLWAQLRADALARPLRIAAVLDAGTVGAAAIAGAAAGLFPSLAAASAALVRLDRTVLPHPAGAQRAEARYALWRELYPALRPLHHALAAR